MSGCECRNGLVLSRTKTEKEHPYVWGIFRQKNYDSVERMR